MLFDAPPGRVPLISLYFLLPYNLLNHMKWSEEGDTGGALLKVLPPFGPFCATLAENAAVTPLFLTPDLMFCSKHLFYTHWSKNKCHNATETAVLESSGDGGPERPGGTVAACCATVPRLHMPCCPPQWQV